MPSLAPIGDYSTHFIDLVAHDEHGSHAARDGGATPAPATEPASPSKAKVLCRHCGRRFRTPFSNQAAMRQHLAFCKGVPTDTKALLDGWARDCAAARSGPFAHTVYTHFTVTGWHRSQCNGCGAVVPGTVTALARHVSQCIGQVEAVDVAAQFRREGGACAECRHCGAQLFAETSGGVPRMRVHLGSCKGVPADLKTRLDREARAAASTRAFLEKHPACRQFECLGLLRWRCRRCDSVVAGVPSRVREHAETRCRGKPRIRVVDAMTHFSAEGGGLRCRYCHTITSAPVGATQRLKRHLAACKCLPSNVRRALDEEAVDEAQDKALVRRKHDTYRHFEVVGLQLSRCRRCHCTVSGNVTQLNSHLAKCATTPTKPQAKVPWPDPSKHFVETGAAGVGATGSGAGQPARTRRSVHVECTFCGLELVVRSLRERSKLLKHLGNCQHLSAELRSQLDAAARLEAQQGGGVYRYADVAAAYTCVGFHMSKCHECGNVVRGDVTNLRQHLRKRCQPGEQRVQRGKRQRTK